MCTCAGRRGLRVSDGTSGHWQDPAADPEGLAVGQERSRGPHHQHRVFQRGGYAAHVLPGGGIWLAGFFKHLCSPAPTFPLAIAGCCFYKVYKKKIMNSYWVNFTFWQNLSFALRQIQTQKKFINIKNNNRGIYFECDWFHRLLTLIFWTDGVALIWHSWLIGHKEPIVLDWWSLTLLLGLMRPCCVFGGWRRFTLHFGLTKPYPRKANGMSREGLNKMLQRTSIEPTLELPWDQRAQKRSHLGWTWIKLDYRSCWKALLKSECSFLF